MKVTKLKARASDYISGTLLTSAVECFEMKNKIVKLFPGKRKDHVLDKLTGFHRDRFQALWGNPSFCWHGYHYFYCWLLNLDDKATILVFTAKEHGTEYELVNRLNGQPVKNHLPTVMKFFKEV
jgi:hypothetical protein